ncbi:MAG: hypothetical protein M1827_002786 [Pycnora praestabilis]|nr:MAG: hypothetical protein M1827_002786 [Pycnora praestabilis]
MSGPSNSINSVAKRNRRKASDGNLSSQQSFQFGKLTASLSPHVVALSRGKDALLKITELFQEYQSEIEIFEKDFGNIQRKDEKIQELQTTVRHMTLAKDNEIEDLEERLQSTAEERTKLEEERTDFEKLQASEKKAVEEKQQQLRDSEGRRKENYRREVEEKKKQLERESCEETEKLRTLNKRLAEDVLTLENNIETAREECVNEKRDYSVLRKSLREDNQKLRSELELIENEFALETRSDDFYIEKFSNIREALKLISSSFFAELPKNPDPKWNLFDGPDKPYDIARFAFLPKSLGSTYLRFSKVESLIAATLCEMIWQPFMLGIASTEPVVRDCLVVMSEQLASHKGRAECTWRALCIRSLQDLLRERDRIDHVTLHMLKLLDPFTNSPNGHELYKALSNIARDAMQIWDISQKDPCKIVIQPNPDPSKRKEWASEYCDLCDQQEEAVAATTSISLPSPVCLFPQIVRGETSTTSPPSTICNGRALFEDSPLIAVGETESLDFQKTMSDLYNQKSRESSLHVRLDQRYSMGI